MALAAAVQVANGRPMLHINGTPTNEFWCYGDAGGIEDFAAGGVRICQFPVAVPWWTGPAQYDFTQGDARVQALLARQPQALLIPRLCFSYAGETWWTAQHPDELAAGRDVHDQPVDYGPIRGGPHECWPSAGSTLWTEQAAAATEAFVRHCEERYGDNMLGYHPGGGITTEWFRWWTFIDGAYEDYSPAATAGFRAFLRERYADDAALQQAWAQPEVTRDTAAVPAASRQHAPALGFFRDPTRERDVLDWLECLSTLNARQALALCAAAKQGCARRKIVGAFFGYFWPHWNTQNPARTGHLALRLLLQSPDVDYISSPYHYDNRAVGGFHHSQSLPQAIERAGKLHVDEIDTGTHLSEPHRWPFEVQARPANAAASCRLLRRDAAAVLGTAGTGWWMDLHLTRWFADATVQAELRDLQQLARQAKEWACPSTAEVALVIDDASPRFAHLGSELNQYFTAMPRQFEWSDLGFPVDTLLLSEVPALRPYKLYVFLNCWHVDTATRAALSTRLRHNGMNAIWFYGAGFYSDAHHGTACIGELTGINVYSESGPAAPAIQLRDSGHPLLEQSLTTPRGALRFGVGLTPERQHRLVRDNPRGWETPAAPLFIVDDADATVLGHYVHDGSPGIAILERGGWSSLWCGAPMLPGWLLHRVAMAAGVHAYTPPGCQVWQRGPLLAVYAPAGGPVTLSARPGHLLTPLIPKGSERAWRPDTSIDPAPDLMLPFAPGETRFFRTGV